jgi:MFS family permease
MRSLLAVVVAFAAMAITVIVATVVSVRLLYPEAEPGRLPAPTATWLAVNFAYSLAAAVLGGWLAAYLAPRAPFAHAVALAVVAVAMALPGILGGGSPTQPDWYPAFMAALAVGGILLGGRLRHKSQLRGESR